MSGLVLQAPAKINLHLRIGPRDATGFHPLASWMCTVSLFDTLSIARSAAQGVHFQCDNPDLPTDSRNLVVRAAERFLEHTAEVPTAEGGVSISLIKRIATAAGLGGGSSDAATTLIGLNRLLNRRWTNARFAEEALALGSDVPFFLAAPSAWCTGRGEKTRLLAPPSVARWAVLVFPPFGLSTAAVYQKFDALGLGKMEYLAEPADLSNWPDIGSKDLLALLVNDLEQPAFLIRPELDELRKAIEGQVCRPVRMSGSGSTLFTLFDSEQEALDACQSLHKRFSIRADTVLLAPTGET